MNLKWLIILIVIPMVLLGACTQKGSDSLKPMVFPPQPQISETRAIALASHYVPFETVMRSEIISGLSSTITEKGAITTWSILFNTANVTREQLEASGWRAGSDTDFGPDNQYSMVAIAINANTGEVVNKTASNGLYLGGPPPAGPISSEEAKIIASRYVPSHIVTRARIEYIGNTVGSKQTWLIYYIFDVSEKELGWHESNNTHLDKLSPNEKYFELVVEVDLNSGDFIRRAAFTLPRVTTSPASSTPSN